MQGIPPAKDTDAEDVVWGLQTAASLWKRGERIDALIWLRRAAQAAGETNDDDRALELARSAAELTDWMANAPNTTVAPSSIDTAAPPEGYSPADDEPKSIEVSLESAENLEAIPVSPAFPPPPPRPEPPMSRPPSQPTMQTLPPSFAENDEDKTPMPSEVDPSEGDRRSASVPPAERVHAGMFNPWDAPVSSQDAPAPPLAPTPVAPVPPPEEAQRSEPPARGASFAHEEEEVVTSVRPQALAEKMAKLLSNAPGAGTPTPIPPASPAPPAPQAPTPARPPPLPPRAQKPSPPRPPVPRATGSTPRTPSAPKRPMPASGTKIQAAPPSVPPDEPTASPPPARVEEAAEPAGDRHAMEPPKRDTPPPPSPTQQMSSPERERLRTASIPPHLAPVDDGDEPPSVGDALAAAAKASFGTASQAPPAAAAPDFTAPPPAAVLDLENVEAFADLPDDARQAFAAAAMVSKLAEGDEVSSFALAYIISGKLDVAATMVDAPAGRIETGAVLRAKGSTDEGVPMRLIAATGEAVVATWTDGAVEEAFRTCPWVEEDLRAAADRVQTLVGITIGPLGERLDMSIRESIVAQLQMRTLLAGEVVVTKGEVVPGLLLVGIGEVELVDDDNVVKGSVGSGDFLFAGEVLGAGSAPLTARAGPGGALVLFGDRRIAQELLVTCPPLLEVFAGM